MSLHSYLKIGAVLLALLATACERIHDVKPGPEPETEVKTKLDQQVRDLEQQGQFHQAAELILRNIQDIEEPRKTTLLLHAVQLLIHAGSIDEANKVIARLQSQPTNSIDKVRITQLRAQILLQQEQADEALALLTVDPAMPLAVSALTHELRARAYLQSGRHIESVRERILLEPLLVDGDRTAHNRQQIWASLNLLPTTFLQEITLEPAPDTLSGWIALTRINKSLTLSTESFTSSIGQWQMDYPRHPASGAIMQNLREHYRAIKKPEKLALLLPLQGKLAKPAAAIRDGFLAAFYEQPDGRSSTAIRVYDTSSSHESIQTIYRQAVAEGAEFVIGPLHKQKVAELASMTDFPVPVLTLNHVENALITTGKLFQFGLNPEDEAQQIAERASLEGRTRAITLTPQGEWGQRLAKAFTQRFQALGGTILQHGQYNYRSNDFSDPIKRVLNIDESEQRYNRLRHALPRTLKFMPRRRQDVDLIFLAAFPRQARQIVPQLRFHHASDIPVYTTSSAYSSGQSKQDNKDMGGVVICDSAWVLYPQEQSDPLQQKLNTLWPRKMGRFTRLYALGVDAYRILSQLRWLQSNPNERFEGATGRLRLGEYNRIHRTLQWGRFEKGEIKPLTNVRPRSLPLSSQPIAAKP